MFSCRACMRRCLYGFIEDVGGNQARGFVSTTVRKQGNYTPINERTQVVRDIVSRDVANAGQRQLSRQEWLDSRGQRPKERPSAKPVFKRTTDAAMRKNLLYLQDSVKLATTVAHYLRDDRYEQALELVQAASRNRLVTVSWNHLIDWQLQKGRTKSAMRTYNDMKKRAQTPDAYTFTILFRGLAKVAQRGAESMSTSGALGHALSLYQSMLKENSPVKPNVIHMNAVLTVCARAGDLDAMMGIAAQFEERGPRAPNTWTYTIIFDAMRSIASNPHTDATSSLNLRRKMNLDARLIWDDIISAWRKGNLQIEETLVCSLGRLLLLCDVKDVDDIFSLVEQSMNIERVFPPIGTAKRAQMGPLRNAKEPDVKVDNGKVEETVDKTELAVAGTVLAAEDSTDKAVEEPADEAGLVRTSDKNVFVSQLSGGYCRPGNNTLSLLAEACLALRMLKPMDEYWSIITKDFGVVPDSHNIIAYLRVLRVARASSRAFELMSSIPPTHLEMRFFRVAMSACERDKLNPNAFANGGKLLQLMHQHLSIQDPTVLESYLDLVIGSKKSVHEMEPVQKFAHGRRLRRGLERVKPLYMQAKSRADFWPESPDGKEEALKEKLRYIREFGNLARKMAGAYDMLIFNGMVDPDELGELKLARKTLTPHIKRVIDKRDRLFEVSKIAESKIKVPSYTFFKDEDGEQALGDTSTTSAEDSQISRFDSMGEKAMRRTDGRGKVAKTQREYDENARSRQLSTGERRHRAQIKSSWSGVDLALKNPWLVRQGMNAEDGEEAARTREVWRNSREDIPRSRIARERL